MAELLLDTSYILPIFGLRIELGKFEKSFPRLLHVYSVIYNPVSLIEAKWITLRAGRKEPSKRDILLQRYRIGLKTLQGDERLKPSTLTDDSIEQIADELLSKEKLADYFDRMIYATAARYNMALLTEDDGLLAIAKGGRVPRPKQVIRWEDAMSEIGLN